MSEQEEEQKFYANLAAEAYKRKDRKMQYEGYIHDNKLSDSRHAIYHNKDNNHTVLAVRGTRTDLSLDSQEDLIDSDLGGIVFSDITATKRYRQAQDKLRQAQEKYKSSKVDLTGHSLGGRVVEELAAREKNVNESHSFNPGSFVQNALKDVECSYSKSQQCKNRKNKVYRYTVEGDVLSMTSHSGRGIKQHIHMKKKKKAFDSHTIKNFL